MSSPRGLFERFERAARSDPSQTLVRVCGNETKLGASRLLDRAHAAAQALREEGVARDDLVALTGSSGAPFVTGALAIWACDAVLLPADPLVSHSELEELHRSFMPRWEASTGPSGEIQVEKTAAPERLSLPPETAVIKISSGSTGRPRGVAVTADQLLADTAHLIEAMEIGPNDLNIAAIPMSHSYGMDSLLMPLVMQGSPLLVVPAPLPHLLAEALSDGQPCVFPGVPYLFDLLARAGGASPSFKKRGLKRCISAGALLRSRTAAAFRDKFDLPVRVFYGTSETGGITYDASLTGDAAVSADGCVGTPLPGVKVSLDGDEGRVVVAGANVASGYVGPCGAALDGQFEAGAFRTGDTGRLDPQGRLHLTGRIGSLVNVSGRKVNPREVEKSLESLEGVSDVAVLGVPDAARGEALVAVLAGDKSLTLERTMSHLRSTLAPYKIPRRILFVRELPRTDRGKLDQDALRREVLGSRAASEEAQDV